MASRVDVIFDATTRGLDRGINKVQGSLGGLSGGFVKTAATAARFAAAGAAAGGAAFVVGKKILGMAENLETMSRRADVVFGEFVGDVRAFADEMDASFGLGSQQLVGFTAGIADMLIPMGFARKEATALSIEAVNLAGQLSIATGEPIQRAIEAMAAGFRGEREMLDSLGIAIDENLVKTLLAEKGWDTLTGAALRQARVQVTMEEALRQTTDSQKIANDAIKDGDLQLNNLNSALENARNSIVEKLGPALEDAAAWLADLVTALVDGDKASGDLDQSARDVAKALTSVWNTARAVAGAIIDIVDAIARVVGPMARFIGMLGRLPGAGIVKNLAGRGLALAARAVFLGAIARRQHGGPLGAGQPAIVGERGPELFIPGASGFVSPNRRLGGGAVVVINVAGSVMSEFDLVETVRRGLRTGAAEGRS